VKKATCIYDTQSGTRAREPRLPADGTICSSQTKVSLARADDVEGGALNGRYSAQCCVSIEHAASSSLRETSWPKMVTIVSTGNDSKRCSCRRLWKADCSLRCPAAEGLATGGISSSAGLLS
jgi:hypothetical protein